MAAIGADKMDDLEDGEISGSDSESEMGITAGERVQVICCHCCFRKKYDIGKVSDTSRQFS